jgi:GABA permease
MEEMGIPAAAEIMNFVVLTAVLSCLNSGLYTASRMLFVLAARREAPARMLSINTRGVPMWSIIASSIIGFACVVAAYVSPDRVFLFLLNSSGAIILFVYLLICLSQLRMRRMVPPERLKVKMWFYPVLTLLTAAAIVGVLVSMFVKGETRSQLVLSLLAWGVVLVAFAAQRRAIGDAHLTEQGIAAESRADAWMHEHGPAAELEVDAVVGEGPLDPELIRRVREEGYANGASEARPRRRWGKPARCRTTTLKAAGPFRAGRHPVTEQDQSRSTPDRTRCARCRSFTGGPPGLPDRPQRIHWACPAGWRLLEDLNARVFCREGSNRA